MPTKPALPGRTGRAEGPPLSASRDRLGSFLEAQRGDYRRALPGMVAQAEALWQDVQAGSPQALAALQRLAHTVYGTAGTYRFDGTCQAALRLEQAASALAEAPQGADAAALLARIDDAIRAFRESLTEPGDQPPTARPAARATAGGTILYAEDDAAMRTIVTLALRKAGGFTVVACASGEEVLGRAADAAADLLLLDVVMPGMDGFATLEALRRLPATAATPVIFMSATVHAGEIARCRSLGALDVIAKPFDPMRLGERIRAAWAAAGG